MSGGQLQDFSVDQAAGAVVLVLGAISGLLLTIWKSRCECDMNCCYIWRCHRKPPPDNVSEIEEEGEGQKDREVAEKEVKPTSPEVPEIQLVPPPPPLEDKMTSKAAGAEIP